MERWMKWSAVVLACAVCAAGGTQLGLWLSFKAYGGPAERIASQFVDEALIVRLAALDGATAQSSQIVRTLLPSLQSSTATVALLAEEGLDAPYPQLVRRAMRQLDANPIVQADEGQWAAAAKAARTCILALPPDASDWSACVEPVGAAWPKPAITDPRMPELASAR